MTTYYYNTNDVRTKQRPASINTSFSSESWSLVSPPLTKADGRRGSNVPYFSLFSTPTWQTGSDTSLDLQQSPPIDFDFLNYPATAAADDYFSKRETGLGNQSQTIVSPMSFVNESNIWSFSGNGNHKEQRPLTPPPQSPTRQIHQLIQQVQQQQKIDEYFSPTCTMIDVQSLGKGVHINQMKENQPIYQVQFKHKHKTEFYYMLDDKERFKIDDEVVVEADRGYDIGTVIAIVEKEHRKKKKLITSNDTVIKRIFRLANAAELLTLEMKKQDEQKALVICQAKIKQKNLSMQVVEAEYQWDRRKLTFYFKANERIDFRELVRELFKIYKTRIWMCASTLD